VIRLHIVRADALSLVAKYRHPVVVQIDSLYLKTQIDRMIGALQALLISKDTAPGARQVTLLKENADLCRHSPLGTRMKGF
jgi:hypothetical protein